MSIKKYTNNAWVDIPYKKYETATDTITSLPKTIIGDGQPISAYTIKGNMVQSGTPTPSNPVYPQEVGDLVTTGEHAGQYEIPISFNGATYPIYLSEPIRKIGDSVDTAPSSGTASRFIKKFVLDGNTQITDSGTSGNYHRYSIRLDGCSNRGSEFSTDVITTHYRIQTGWGNGNAYLYSEFLFISLLDSEYPNSTSLKNFFSAQQAAGTPVTVWYQLATPTTEQFTAPTIPTSGSPQSFDVDTTLKPSEVSLTWHGWHEHEDTKFTT